MKRGGFIITITGPSQSGKSLVMKKITELGEELYSRGVSFSQIGRASCRERVSRSV